MKRRSRFMKQFLAVVLSAAMLTISTLSIPAFAAEAQMPEMTEVSKNSGMQEKPVTGEQVTEEPAAEEPLVERPAAEEPATEEAEGNEVPAGEVTGTGTADDPWVVSTWAELKDKMTSGGHIKLNDNVRPGDPANSGCLEVPTSASVTLDLNGKTIDRGLAEMGAVENGNVIIVSGNLTLKDDSEDKTGTITGGNPKSGDGGGVSVDENGSFTMKGGIISGNQTQDRYSGGGVYVGENGTFTMNDGTICNNKAQDGGGVCIRYADFTMNGGTICHNRAHSDQYNNGLGGGISVVGRPDKSAGFTMNGGTINNNTADVVGGGMYIDHTGFSMTDGEIVGNKLSNEGRTREGGGIFVNVTPSDQPASFVMSGGRICGNSADKGGGVYVSYEGAFTMTGGVISGNSVTEGDSHNGGGVFVSRGTFNVSDSPVIKNNTKGNEANNVEFGSYDEYINVTGTLTEMAELSVWGVEDNRMIAQGSGYTIKDTDAARFFSDGGRCFVELDQDKVVLKIKTTWAGLQSLLDNASTSTKIKLNWDATASENDAGLVVKRYTNVELELNGFKIDRGLAGKEPVENGYVIEVSPDASLTVSDSSELQTGTITGGNNTGEGGGVCMAPSTGVLFKLTGGTIKGNNAQCGGGVYVGDGDCYISGKARIEGNSCFDKGGYDGQGGGVDVCYGNVSLQDNPVIRDNVRNGTWDSKQGVYTSISNNNLYLSSADGSGRGARKIGINSTLTSGASIGVTLDELRKFTNNWNSIMGSANPAGFFTSDDSDYTVVLQDGEAALVSHSHHFTYTSDGAVITAICSNSDGKCPLDGHKASLTIAAPLLSVYDERDEYGKIKDPEAQITDKNNIRDGAEISYYKADANGNRSGAPLKDAPKNAGRYRAEITLGSGSNSATAYVAYEIEKAVPVYIIPTDLKAVYGQTLKDVKLPLSENGVWSWPDEAASVGNAGTNTFRAVYTPRESENYKIAEAEVAVEVAKAQYEKTSLSANQRFGTTGMIELKSNIPEEGAAGNISSIAGDTEVLSGNAAVRDNVLSCTLKDNREYVNKSVRFTIPVKNCKNYLDYDLTVTLTVADCSHTSTELRHVVKATCMDEGYSGDVCCAECNALIKKGEKTPIDPDNHDFNYADKTDIAKEPTYLSYGSHTYHCNRNHDHTIVVADIDPLPSPDGNNYEDLAEDTRGLSGNDIITGTDESGNETETVKVGGEEISTTVTDPLSGKETVVSKVWIGGLKEAYRYNGSAIKPSFHVYDGTKILTEKTDYTVSWKNNKDAGTATATVKFKGNYKDSNSETVSFKIDAAVLGEDIIVHEIGVAAKKKGSVKVSPVLTWAETGKAVSSRYFDINPSSVTGEGTTDATVTVKSGQNNFAGSATVKVKAVGNKDKLLSNAKEKFNPSSYPYTGSEITPKYELTLGGKTLTEGTDYKRISLCNNINPGTATVVFEALNGSSAGIVGSKTATFKITGKKELKEGTSFTFTCQDPVPYAKGGAKASVTVTDNDNHAVLTEGRDYTLSYSKNKALTNGAKTAEVKITGKGNYKSSVTLKFAIEQQSLKAISENIIVSDQFTTKAKLKAPKITITDVDGKKLKVNTDYTVGETDTSDPANTDTKGIVKVKITGKGAYKNETLTVSYRYEDKINDISKAKGVNKIADQDYTGNAVKLSNAELTGILTAKDKTGADVSLVPGVHFAVTGYANNVKKGTAKVTVRGIGDFAGTKTITFKIVQKKVDYKGALTGDGWK